MAIGSNPNVPTEKIVEILESDPLLAIKVAQVANSALFRGQSSFRSIKDIVVRVGRTNLINIAMEVSVSAKIFRNSLYQEQMDRISYHSRMSAAFAQIIAKRTSLDPHYAFFIGLLHDIGIAASLVALADVPRGQVVPELDLGLYRALDSIHEHAGGIVSDLWGLPQEVVLAIENHHRPFVDNHFHPGAGVILLAEELASSLQVGWALEKRVGVDFVQAEMVEAAKRHLKISDFQWKLIVEEAQRKKFGK
jgi:HD-like signal output (HDOD) protein